MKAALMIQQWGCHWLLDDLGPRPPSLCPSVPQSSQWRAHPLVIPEVVELPALLLLARLPVLMLVPPSGLVSALLEPVLLEAPTTTPPLHWSAVHQMERILLQRPVVHITTSHEC